MMGGRNYKDTVKDGKVVSYGKLGYYYTTGFDKNNYDYGENKSRYDVYNQGEYKLNCIVIAVDTGYDGTVARYKGKTYAYSNPTVTAILQAAPYFSEFNNTEGNTSYGITTSYTITNTNEESVSYSVGATAEAAAPGIKLTVGSGYTSGWSKSFEESCEESYTLIFSAQQENNVIVQRTPVFMYMYEVQDNQGNWIDSKGAGTFQIAVPQQPVYQQLSVESYNEFVGAYNRRINSDEGGLTAEQRENAILWSIKDKTLLGNEGKPSLYADNWSEVGGTRIGSGAVLTLGINDGDTTEEGSKALSVTEGTSRSNGFYFEASISAGASFALGEAWAGVSTSMDGSKTYGVSETKTNATMVSGTVTNLSTGRTGISTDILKNYAFNWTFGTWNLNLGRINNRAVPVLGYTVSGLRSGIDAPLNLKAAKGAADNIIQLTWSAVESAEGYNLYMVENDSTTKINTDALIQDTAYSFTIPDNMEASSFVFVATSVKGNSESVDSNQAIFYRSNAGKSAYDIARDNGFNGTEEEWLASLVGSAGADGKDGVGISTITIDESGMLAVALTDGTTLALGNVMGQNGEDGAGIAGLMINEAGELIVTLTDGTEVNLGGVVGKEGDKGDPGEDGREMELRTADSYIQWRYAGEDDTAWRNLIALSEISGADGVDGEDGRNMELQTAGGYIQWRLQGDDNWLNLIPLSEITGSKGDKGDSGDNGTNGSGGTNNTSGTNGSVGQNGYNGRDGRNGKDGIDGKDGVDGKDGAKGDKGDPGIGVADIKIDENNNFIFTMTDGSTINAGSIQEEAIQAMASADGQDNNRADSSMTRTLATTAFIIAGISLLWNVILMIGSVIRKRKL